MPLPLIVIAGITLAGVAGLGYALYEIFREKRCILLEGNVEAGKTTIVRCLKGEKFKTEYTSTPKIDEDIIETEIGEWTLYDAGGSKGLYELKEKLRNEVKDDFKKVAYVYVFNAEKCRNSLPKEILYRACNCSQEANEWGFKALAIGTRGDKLRKEECSRIINGITQKANIPCEIFDMTQSPQEALAKFIDRSVK